MSEAQAVNGVRVPALRRGEVRIVITPDNRELVDNGGRKKVTFYRKDNKVEHVRCLERIRKLDQDHNQVIVMTMPDGQYQTRRVNDYNSVVFG